MEWVVQPTCLQTCLFVRPAWILVEGTHPALMHRCAGDSRVGSGGCVPPSWLLFSMSSPQLICEYICMSRPLIFVSDACGFPSCECVILLLSRWNEAQHWNSLVEPRYDREHVQAIRVFVGRETVNAVFFLQKSLRLYRWSARMDATRLVFDQSRDDVVATLIGVQSQAVIFRSGAYVHRFCVTVNFGTA